jgi:CheY-like chemotaxis protein
MTDQQTPLAMRRVLCVQPNEGFHAALRVALSKHRLVFVPNAVEALRLLNANSFDAYVLDYWLPDWSGASLCRQIRQTDPHAPVCFFTAAHSPEQKKRAIRAGAQAFFFAPNDAGTLAVKLRTWLQYVDLGALRAKLEEEAAVQHELERRAAVALARTEHARMLAQEALERAAQARARKAFIASGGTLATFERWWPQTFGSAVANHRATSGSAA